MDSRRFSAAEKGKGVTSQPNEAPVKRVRAPVFDTSALIRDNALTLIGRVTNPKEQPVDSLISALPRKWSLKGQVSGSDLGQDCFQFRFELEEDLLQVLLKRPFHYNQWMLILQWWEPVISPSFPSQIPLWIKLQGLPLHFWHEKMIYDLGQDLGTLEEYKITKTSARIRVSFDGLKPLPRSALVEFESGEELMVNFDYEDLGYNCSRCYSLSHLARSCPSATVGEQNAQRAPAVSRPQEQSLDSCLRTRDPRHSEADPFNQRVDRHGRPFGERIPLPEFRGRPLQNKIVPSLEGPRNQRQQRASSYYRPISPPNQVRARQDVRSRSPARRLREKTRPVDTHQESRGARQITPACDSPRGNNETQRPPLERNLEITDSPPHESSHNRRGHGAAERRYYSLH
ncbi:uncharacterized protein LOC103862666 [Brassica rapa]|uniref:uncharacterized protein LOC103862666 n=1 Tax=Brassica campestris TaxID=3711 RepID=UPI00142DEEB3|nr:uncharacterized protein LOC103862666 [Brassica rapa]